MQVSVSDAKGQLLDLVRRAEAGEEVVLTRHGHDVVRLVPVRAQPDRAERRVLLEEMFGIAHPEDGATAAASQDVLYDAQGLPR